MLAGDNAVNITFKTTADQVSSLRHHDISKNNIRMNKLNFVLSLTSVLKFLFCVFALSGKMMPSGRAFQGPSLSTAATKPPAAFVTGVL